MGNCFTKSKAPKSNIKHPPKPYDPVGQLTVTVEDLKLEKREIMASQGTLVSQLYQEVKTKFNSEREFSLYSSGKPLWKNEEKTLGEYGLRDKVLIDLVYKPK